MSVQLVTYERPGRMLEALAQIALQDYAGPLEVVVIDDSRRSSAERVAEFAEAASLSVNYRHLPDKLNVGAKRNLAVRSATASADLMVTWDDDDIFTVDRISRQVAALMDRPELNCSIVLQDYFYFAPRGRLLIGVHQYDFQENVLCFRRSWHEAGTGFEETSLSEGRGLFRGRELGPGVYSRPEPWKYPLARVASEDLPYLYVRHPRVTASDLSDQLEGRRGLRCYEPESVVDRRLLGLASALLHGRFPHAPYLREHSAALRATRAAVCMEIERDLQTLEELRDPQLASAYLAGLAASETPRGAGEEDLELLLSAIEGARRQLAIPA